MSITDYLSDPLYARAIETVEEQFELARDYVTEASTKVEALLSTLQEIGTGITLIETDVALADLNYVVPPFVSVKPTKPIVELNVGTKPERGNFKNVDLSDLDIPDISSLSISTSPVNSAVTTYSSSLLTALQSRLLADIQTDIDRTSTESNKAARGQERLLLKHNDLLDKIRAGWSQSNLPMPDGVLVADIESENKRYADEYSDLNRTIFIEESNLALQTRNAAIGQATALEQVLMGFVQTTQQRIFDASKATLDGQIAVYNVEIGKYRMMTDIYQAISNIRIAEARNYVDMYVAEVTGYRAELEAEMARIDALLRNFTAEIDAYRADVQVYQALSGVEIEILKSQLQLAVSRAELYLKNADMQIKEYESQTGLKIEVVKAMGAIVAQEVAGFASSIHASASMSRGDSSSTSHTYSETIE